MPEQEGQGPQEMGMCQHGNFPQSCELCRGERDFGEATKPIDDNIENNTEDTTEQKEYVKATSGEKALVAVLAAAVWAEAGVFFGASDKDADSIDKQGFMKTFMDKARAVYSTVDQVDDALSSGDWGKIFEEKSKPRTQVG